MLVVEVEDAEDGSRRTFNFATSPVRVGRSPLNDLPLPRGFVSHCHGVLHFDTQRCQFVDLGSTNGSSLLGQRMPPNVPQEVDPAAVIQIGPLSLRPRVENGTRSERHSTSYAFSEYLTEEPSGPSAGRGQQAPERVAPAADPADALRPAYQQYRAAWRQLRDRLSTTLQHLPQQDRERAAGELLAEFPDLAQEAEFRRMIGTERPATPPQGTPAAAQQLLQRFAQILIELRNSQRTFRADLSLPLGPRSGIVEEAQSADELLTYLLAPGHAAERLEELSRAFADMMLHQVAVLNAVRDGMREVLEPLDPSTLSLRVRGPLGLLSRLFGRDARWTAFRREFDNLREESVLSSRLFGRAFAKAYTAVMSGHASQKLPPRNSTRE